MKFTITKASDWDFEDEQEIDSLEDLLNFIKKNGGIIMNEHSIKIYDDYI